jgi:hypothetical protein
MVPGNETISNSTTQGLGLPLLFGSLCDATTSILPFRFSFTQQVHIKLKADSTVIFLVHIVKQGWAYWTRWRAEKTKKAVQIAKAEAKKEHTRRKRSKDKRNKKLR